MDGNQLAWPLRPARGRGGFGQRRFSRKSSNAPSQNFEPGAFKVDEAEKSQYLEWWRRKPKLRRANLSGVRPTYVRRSDFEMQRNAEIGLLRRHQG
jgi:hypothetical protein